MKYEDRYASAVRSSNLKSEPGTTFSSSDVVAAAGLAAKLNPLAMALLRLFTGDNRAAPEIVGILADMAWGRSRFLEVKLRRSQAEDIARAVLAWHRDGVCKACGGHGYQRIKGTPNISDVACLACRGTKKVPFDSQISAERLEIARWLQAQVAREQSVSGPAAMALLAPLLR